MKSYYFLLIAIFSCTSYNNSDKKELLDTNNNEQIGANIYGVQKEIFRDFLIKFSTDTNYQVERVFFPLEIENPNIGYVSKQDWKFDTCFKPSEYIWSFIDSIPNKKESTSEGKIAVNFSKKLNIYKLYYFEIVNKKWYLKKIKFNNSTERLECKTSKESFLKFIDKFTNDSNFQISRVKFPLASKQLNLDNGSVDSFLIKRTEYKKLSFKDDDAVEYKELNSFYDNEKELSFFFCKSCIVVAALGNDFNNIQVRYFFRNIEGIWYLVLLTDFST